MDKNTTDGHGGGRGEHANIAHEMSVVGVLQAVALYAISNGDLLTQRSTNTITVTHIKIISFIRTKYIPTASSINVSPLRY